MKRLLILAVSFFLICFAKRSVAQGNLQFNQVVFYDIAISGTQAINVPANKVWKIESTSNGSSGTPADIFLRNSAAQNIGHFSAASSATSAVYPFWLSSGYIGSLVNNSPSFRCCVSIIEFNIVP